MNNDSCGDEEDSINTKQASEVEDALVSDDEIIHDMLSVIVTKI